jgi:hypothetical protein
MQTLGRSKIVNQTRSQTELQEVSQEDNLISEDSELRKVLYSEADIYTTLRTTN